MRRRVLGVRHAALTPWPGLPPTLSYCCVLRLVSLLSAAMSHSDSSSSPLVLPPVLSVPARCTRPVLQLSTEIGESFYNILRIIVESTF